MSEIDYEPINKDILDKCCKAMDATTASKKLKARNSQTRRRIEELNDRKKLRDDIELSC